MHTHKIKDHNVIRRAILLKIMIRDKQNLTHKYEYFSKYYSIAAHKTCILVIGTHYGTIQNIPQTAAQL